VKGARAKALTEEIQGEHAKALVLKCMVEMIKTYPDQFRRGVNRTEMKTWFPRIMKFLYCPRCRRKVSFGMRCEVCGTILEKKSMELATYGNRMRDLVIYEPYRAGRHDCPSKTREKRRFFPLALHEQGLIDHSKCWNCEVPVVE